MPEIDWQDTFHRTAFRFGQESLIYLASELDALEIST